MAEVKIHNNKCTRCGKEVKTMSDAIDHYKCFNEEE